MSVVAVIRIIAIFSSGLFAAFCSEIVWELRLRGLF